MRHEILKMRHICVITAS